MSKVKWQITVWGKSMEKLHAERRMKRWEREVRDDKGKNTIDEWVKHYKHKKWIERREK